ncbi:33504_t:CDS:1, partial [Gigaspora margarita]
AYLLDPKFVGCNLEEDGMSIVSDFLEQYYLDDAEDIYTQILQYKSQTGPFQNQLAWKTVNKVDSITWWNGNFKTSASKLCKFAQRILTIPTSSASSECNWSAFSFIHNIKRNRLTPDK